MDICVLNPFFYPYKGGTEKVLLEVYGRLSKRHNITVITSAPLEKNRPYVEEIAGIRVVRLRTLQRRVPRMPMPFLLFDGLKSALVREKSDIYHINNRYQYFGDTISIVKGMNKKIALTIHNAVPVNIDFVTDELGRFYDWLWGKKVMRAADVITGVSTNTVKTTVPTDCLPKTQVIFNGVDYKRFRRINKTDKGVRRITHDLGFDFGTNIITNGRLVPQKGQIYLMQAFAELVNIEHRNLNLLIIGSGPMKNKLYSYAEKMGIEERFRITNGITDGLLPYYYNACDVFAFPSLYEPAGLAVCEAMACEIPVVASKVGGIPEMVGDCGVYTKPKDYYSIKERLSYVLENRKEVRNTAMKARERMIKRHDWDDISRKYESLFSSVIKY